MSFRWGPFTLSSLFPQVGSCTYSFTPTFKATSVFSQWSETASNTASTSATINLVKSGSPHPPIAIAKQNPKPVTSGGQFTLVGSNSCDPDGQAMEYNWYKSGALVGTQADIVQKAPVISDLSAIPTVIYELVVKNGSGGSSMPLTLSLQVSSSATFDWYSIASQYGFCFIATAAYGTPMAPEVNALRAYRDQVLVRSWAGRALVASYYRLAPPVAKFIEDKPWLRALVRAALKPVIVFARKRLEVEGSGITEAEEVIQ
jgi:hypothetical protein